MSEHKDIVVTLVHGTFARETEWTDERSDLIKFLRENIADEIQFDRFLWSGHNSYEDRQLAGKKLSDDLDRKISAQPIGCHFVISHSHGGNVALYAARNMQNAEKLNGIACLGTPFLSVTAKDNRLLTGLRGRVYSLLPAMIAWSVGLILIIVVVFGTVAIAELVSHTPPSVLNNNYVLIVLGLLIMAMLVAGLKLNSSLVDTYIMKPIQRQFERVRSNRRLRADQFKNTLNYADLPNTNILSLSYKWDEAGLYLAALHGTTSVPLSLAKMLFIAAGIICIPLLVWMIWLYLSPIGTMLATQLGYPEYAKYVEYLENSIRAKYKGYDDLYLYLIFGLVVGVLALARLARGLAFLRSSGYGFGKLPRWMHEYLNIEPVSQPTIEAQSLVHYEFGDVGNVGEDALRHNLIHKDTQALEKLVDWIQRCVRESR